VTYIQETWLERLKKNRIIAVIRTDDNQLGLNMALSVAQAGIELIEITWNSQNPIELIEKLQSELPNCLIGTGTILTVSQLKEAIAIGVQFCFTPHINLEIIEEAKAVNLPIIPGALSPTEIVTAWQAGASSVKVFPVEAVGGVRYIQSLQSPLTGIPLIPTGGVTLDNAREFILKGAIAVGLSSDLYPKLLLKEKNWPAITERAKKLLDSLVC